MRIDLLWLPAWLTVCLTLWPAQSSLAQTVLTSPAARVQLLELYTSEGCSSCPPADKWLSQLRRAPGLWTEIVPVAFHVDYWNYLGWRDQLADSRFSERQRRYRRSGGVKSVYTPGFVVGGREWRGWFQRRPLPQAEPAPVGVLAVTVTDNRYRAQFTRADGVAARPLELYVALLGMDLKTDIKRGENRGRRLTHDFAVLGLSRRPAGEAWTGTLPQRDPGGSYGLAAWVSPVGELTPVQAVGGYLPP
ncbi:DUF1223 domain-containing protein [Exilibacterium tricleocarpae]|uniref:DUF1223 domain-containing protein n=1 Tax=Exilibacterium tricleocarpae TaxID=2591008 RepID=A0A545SMQ3_9GAMM|nr:DUF1223 domain-containing protein [Exilibacterium tricleocarpae]TQV66136.1 DUF1223 domain-containing protein [Exilibacterium tricleocarpae]